MSSWHSYPSIYNVGHAAMMELWRVPCVVEEKVDGSQFSFGVFDGVLRCRSKNQDLVIDHPVDLFTAGVVAVQALAAQLHDGWTYRGEYLRVPSHGHLKYERVPANHVVVFDINDAEESYLSYDAMTTEANRLGLEVVPRLHEGDVTPDLVAGLLQRMSMLGGVTVEGVVLKPVGYGLFGRDKKALMAKHVAPEYRETQKLAWKQDNPKAGDIIQIIGTALATEARWRKSIRHAEDDGALQNAPQDIGPLMKRIESDVKQEEEENIKAALFSWAWPQLKRMAGHGFPDWYKNQLLHRVDVEPVNDEAKS